MTVRSAVCGLLAAVVVATTGSCAADDDPAAASSSTRSHEPRGSHGPKHGTGGGASASSSETSATNGDDAPPFPESTAEQSAKNSGDWDLVLTDVRVGAHDGYDRVVLEFAGSGSPCWYVHYVDEPVLDGSGERAELDGDAFLDIYASGTTYPAEGAGSYDGPRHLGSAGPALSGVQVVGTFEGDTQVIAGISGGEVPFRVFALSGPPRLVVDVATGS